MSDFVAEPAALPLAAVEPCGRVPGPLFSSRLEQRRLTL